MFQEKGAPNNLIFYLVSQMLVSALTPMTAVSPVAR